MKRQKAEDRKKQEEIITEVTTNGSVNSSQGQRV